MYKREFTDFRQLALTVCALGGAFYEAAMCGHEKLPSEGEDAIEWLRTGLEHAGARDGCAFEKGGAGTLCYEDRTCIITAAPKKGGGGTLHVMRVVKGNPDPHYELNPAEGWERVFI